jgi:hypothetical protein
MAGRAHARRRYQIPGAVLVVLRSFFRYSPWRGAYVLRGVGNRVGPVLRRR